MMNATQPSELDQHLVAEFIIRKSSSIDEINQIVSAVNRLRAKEGGAFKALSALPAQAMRKAHGDGLPQRTAFAKFVVKNARDTKQMQEWIEDFQTLVANEYPLSASPDDGAKAAPSKEREALRARANDVSSSSFDEVSCEKPGNDCEWPECECRRKDLQGTFACPICGVDTPHHHDTGVVKRAECDGCMNPACEDCFDQEALASEGNETQSSDDADVDNGQQASGTPSPVGVSSPPSSDGPGPVVSDQNADATAPAQRSVMTNAERGEPVAWIDPEEYKRALKARTGKPIVGGLYRLHPKQEFADDVALYATPPADLRGEVIEGTIQDFLNAQAEYWATSFGGLSSGDDVSEWISGTLHPELIEAIRALSPSPRPAVTEEAVAQIIVENIEVSAATMKAAKGVAAIDGIGGAARAVLALFNGKEG